MAKTVTKKRAVAKKYGKKSKRSVKTRKIVKPVVEKGFVKVKAQAKVEVKRVIGSVSLSLGAGTANFQMLACPAPGVASNQRDGRAIQVRGYQSRLIYSPGTSSTNNNVRMIYFLWKEAYTTPTLSDILNVSGGTDGMIGTYNVNKAALYTILSDDTYNNNPLTQSVGGSSYVSNTGVFLKNQSVKFNQTFNDASSTPNDIAIYVLVVSQSTATMSGDIAVSYIDI